MLKGAITALITPMNNNGDIDFISLENLVNWQIDSGVSGLVVAGTTGEPALLDKDEIFQLIKKIITINQKRVKIIVGISSPSTKFSADYLENYLNKIEGIDYILALAPYYIRPTQDGLYDYFSTIAKVSRNPVILYNVPARTGCDIQNKTILALAHNCVNIVALKDATGEIDRVIELSAMKPKGFLLLSGDDESALPFILNGGDGVISVVSNIVPKEFSDMCNLAINVKNDEANKVKAIAINEQIKELCSTLFIEPNPIPVKFAAFAMNKIKTPVLRSPLTTLLPDNQRRLSGVLEKFLGYKVNVK